MGLYGNDGRWTVADRETKTRKSQNGRIDTGDIALLIVNAVEETAGYEKARHHVTSFCRRRTHHRGEEIIN